jgi:hypothetical protein
MKCENCDRSYDAAALACPYCRAAVHLDGLARVSSDRLDRSATEALLSRYDTGIESLLGRELAGPLALDELRDAVARVDAGDPSLAELESSLDRDATLALDGIALSDLVAPRSAEVTMIRRGLALARRRLWAEVLEWWALHRASHAGNERMQLVLLLLEAFTHRLAGDPARAAQTHARIAAHPIYRRMRGPAPRLERR